jgi:hypothetical protein
VRVFVGGAGLGRAVDAAEVVEALVAPGAPAAASAGVGVGPAGEGLPLFGGWD